MEPIVLNGLRRRGGQANFDLDRFTVASQAKPYEITIWFVLDDERFHIAAADVSRQWVRTAQARHDSSWHPPITNPLWLPFGTAGSRCIRRS